MLNDLDLNQLKDGAFWKGLAPDLHVFDIDFMARQKLFNVENNFSEQANFLLKKEGYFEIPPPDWDLPIKKMAEIVAKIDELGLPTPFSFIYDEFWCMYLKLNKILDTVLGKNFLRLPDFWAWLVNPKKDESGWQPHRDKNYLSLFDDRSPKAVTIWIPLTQSTPLNGCMYIVPADRDPTYGTPQDHEQKFNLADVRALPAEAGSIFCWTQAAFHWGSHSSTRAPEPRISLAFEYQSNLVEPFNQPLTNPYEIPNFAFRLGLIAKQILQYQHMYPLDPEMKKFSENILEKSA